MGMLDVTQNDAATWSETDRADGTRRVQGRVKWFDPVRGFGFVLDEDGGADILLHANVLRSFGQSSVADAALVDLDVQATERGVQATAVHNIVPPEAGGVPSLPDFEEIDAETLAATPLAAARVKWFDKGKGFGFANTFGDEADVFVHVEVLRRAGLADLQPGEALAMRVIEGKRGRMAVEVSSWEGAITE